MDRNALIFNHKAAPVHIDGNILSRFCIGDSIGENATFQATVIEATNNSLLVEPIEGSPELSSADQFSIPNKDGLELQTGNNIEIEYSGDILETYPAQLGEVFNITIVQKD